jgi:hypothetical protein
MKLLPLLSSNKSSIELVRSKDKMSALMDSEGEPSEMKISERGLLSLRVYQARTTGTHKSCKKLAIK